MNPLSNPTWIRTQRAVVAMVIDQGEDMNSLNCIHFYLQPATKMEKALRDVNIIIGVGLPQ